MADRTTITISHETKAFLDHVRDRFFPGSSYDELLRRLCLTFMSMYATFKTIRTLIDVALAEVRD